MSRWKITIEYDGRAYAGFQIQPDIATVQEKIQKALHQFCQQEIKITVAGRTDAGVHARAQVAHLDLDYKHADGTPRALDGFGLAKAMNAYLIDESISIIDAVAVPDDFHARFSATNKLYMYRIINRPFGLALDKGLAWWVKRPLDVAAMNEAAQVLIGHHDFTSFRDTECQAKSPVRTLDKLWFETRDITNGQDITVYAEGRSFLHHQVRNMVGTLTLVGEGKWTKQDVVEALAARERAAAGPTAPSDGLYLMRIDYA